jgi:hypothetical protein
LPLTPAFSLEFIFTWQQVSHAQGLISSGEESRAAVAELFGINMKTLQRVLATKTLT